MSVFGCMNDEQLDSESEVVRDFYFKSKKITKKDLIKLRLKQADDMETFLKSKDLYQEYYDIFVAPEIVFKINFDDIWR